jgi:hypothetical protein
VWPAPLPSAFIVKMLRREALLTRAKLHHIEFEQLQFDRLVRTLKVQLKQGEPEFERLKREVEEVRAGGGGEEGERESACERERCS